MREATPTGGGTSDLCFFHAVWGEWAAGHVNSSPRPCRDPSVLTAPKTFANGVSQPSRARAEARGAKQPRGAGPGRNK